MKLSFPFTKVVTDHLDGEKINMKKETEVFAVDNEVLACCSRVYIIVVGKCSCVSCNSPSILVFENSPPITIVTSTERAKYFN